MQDHIIYKRGICKVPQQATSARTRRVALPRPPTNILSSFLSLCNRAEVFCLDTA
ncbi:hypothetical protein J6590_061939 [Homalodisca vitripennis]|nr:hypothetical protein J6590_061939 [Homalodisca vitripennis]